MLETITWIILGSISLLALVGSRTINPQFDPKGNDPYRYCPKEEEE